MHNGKNWLLAAWICLIFSIIAMVFMPIVTYTSSNGVETSFPIQLLLTNGEFFSQFVLNDYNGPVLIRFQGIAVTGLAVVAILAVACAIMGLVLIWSQRPRSWQYRLTFIGLVGVAVPSLLILLGVCLSGRYFNGTLRCGAAPVITPIAMIISIVAVAQRKNRSKEALEAKLIAEGKMMRGGDLE